MINRKPIVLIALTIAITPFNLIQCMKQPFIDLVASGNKREVIERLRREDISDEKIMDALRKIYHQPKITTDHTDIIAILQERLKDSPCLRSFLHAINAEIIEQMLLGNHQKKSLLFAMGVDENDQSRSRKSALNEAFVKTAAAGNIEKAKKLLIMGADINYQQGKSRETALHKAYLNRDPFMISFLIDQGANEDLQDAKKREPHEVYMEPKERIRENTEIVLKPKHGWAKKP